MRCTTHTWNHCCSGPPAQIVRPPGFNPLNVSLWKEATWSAFLAALDNAADLKARAASIRQFRGSRDIAT
eukprot:gene12181-10500_t